MVGSALDGNGIGIDGIAGQIKRAMPPSIPW
jgi:hypothetical protein